MSRAARVVDSRRRGWNVYGWRDMQGERSRATKSGTGRRSEYVAGVFVCCVLTMSIGVSIVGGGNIV